MLNSNFTCLVTSPALDDTTRHVRSTCRAHVFWLCRACRTARLDTFDTTGSTRRTCHVETWRAKWYSGFTFKNI